MSSSRTPLMAHRLGAEALGTFWLVFGGCGSAVLAAQYMSLEHRNVNLGIGFVGVALAFGLTVLTMVYAVGHVSGGHFNPAVTLGLATAGRFAWTDLLPYWGAQLVGGSLGASVLWIIAKGDPHFVLGNFASNGYGELSPGKFTMWACLLCEVVCTAFFVYIILGATDGRAPKGFAPIAIGLGLTLIHLISIPVTNTSVNPARSTAVALFAGMAYVKQLWLFWLAPLIGAIIAGFTYAFITGVDRSGRDIDGAESNVTNPLEKVRAASRPVSKPIPPAAKQRR